MEKRFYLQKAREAQELFPKQGPLEKRNMDFLLQDSVCNSLSTHRVKANYNQIYS